MTNFQLLYEGNRTSCLVHKPCQSGNLDIAVCAPHGEGSVTDNAWEFSIPQHAYLMIFNFISMFRFNIIKEVEKYFSVWEIWQLFINRT